MACDVNRLFETSAALTLLGEMIDAPAVEAMPAVIKAWDSAWIACLTNCPRWAAVAERDFDRAVADMAAILRSTPGKTPGQDHPARRAWPFFSVTRIEPSHLDLLLVSSLGADDGYRSSAR